MHWEIGIASFSKGCKEYDFHQQLEKNNTLKNKQKNCSLSKWSRCESRKERAGTGQDKFSAGANSWVLECDLSMNPYYTALHTWLELSASFASFDKLGYQCLTSRNILRIKWNKYNDQHSPWSIQGATKEYHSFSAFPIYDSHFDKTYKLLDQMYLFRARYVIRRLFKNM